jgi:hypothetical protein
MQLAEPVNSFPPITPASVHFGENFQGWIKYDIGCGDLILLPAELSRVNSGASTSFHARVSTWHCRCLETRSRRVQQIPKPETELEKGNSEPVSSLP